MPVWYNIIMSINIRDKRNTGWFYLDNKYLNGYAKIFGAMGTAVYVSLCRHADAEQKCYPAQELIADELGIATRTVRKYLKIFVEYNLIHIKRKKSKEGKWLNNVYYLIDKEDWKQINSTHRQPVPMAKKKKPQANDDKNHRHVLPTKNTSNTKNTHISEQSSQVNKIFDIFYESINPNINYGNTTSRKAVEFMLGKYGPVKTKKIAYYAVKVQGREYAPTITTPYQPKEQMAGLLIYYKREKNNTNGIRAL